MRFSRAAFALLLAACAAPQPHQNVPGADAGVDAAGPGRVDGAVGHDAAPDAEVAAASCQPTLKLTGHASSTSVWLTGDYVAWAGSPGPGGATPLVLGGDGTWTVVHPFNAGSYLYKFIVDGTQWISDPSNSDQVDDGFGGKNSRFVCNP